MCGCTWSVHSKTLVLLRQQSGRGLGSVVHKLKVFGVVWSSSSSSCTADSVIPSCAVDSVANGYPNQVAETDFKWST